MKKIKMLFALMIMLTVVFGLSMTSHATLTTIGTATYGGSDYNLIYDSEQSITWLDYSNPAAIWDNQVAWAAGLNGAGVLSYNLNPGVTAIWSGDWRLPTTLGGPDDYGYDGTTSRGFNITSSEMGHLYYTGLGNAGYRNIDGSYNSNYGIDYGLIETGDFENLFAATYSSGTEFAIDPAFAYIFMLRSGDLNGYQTTSWKGYDDYLALAVRSGDVSIVVTPEPSTYLLLGSGIAGLIIWKRKRKLTA